MFVFTWVRLACIVSYELFKAVFPNLKVVVVENHDTDSKYYTLTNSDVSDFVEFHHVFKERLGYETFYTVRDTSGNWLASSEL